MDNDIKKVIPDTVIDEIQTKLNEIKTLLSSYIVSLTPAERRNMLKMGDKSLAFVEKSHDFAIENPTIVPQFLDMQMFDTDFDNAHGLWTVRNDAMQVYEMIDDTAMVSGSESFNAALVFYNSVKVAAAQDIPGAKAIYEDLKTHFPRVKSKNNPPEQ
jgi:hypothetical protein